MAEINWDDFECPLLDSLLDMGNGPGQQPGQSDAFTQQRLPEESSGATSRQILNSAVHMDLDPSTTTTTLNQTTNAQQLNTASPMHPTQLVTVSRTSSTDSTGGFVSSTGLMMAEEGLWPIEDMAALVGSAFPFGSSTSGSVLPVNHNYSTRLDPSSNFLPTLQQQNSMLQQQQQQQQQHQPPLYSSNMLLQHLSNGKMCPSATAILVNPTNDGLGQIQRSNSRSGNTGQSGSSKGGDNQYRERHATPDDSETPLAFSPFGDVEDTFKPDVDLPDVSKRRKVAQACVHCKKAHVSCEVSRPCRRCIKKGTAESCIDAPRKVVAPPPANKSCRTCPVRILPMKSSAVESAPITMKPVGAACSRGHAGNTTNAIDMYSVQSRLASLAGTPAAASSPSNSIYGVVSAQHKPHQIPTVSSSLIDSQSQNNNNNLAKAPKSDLTLDQNHISHLPHFPDQQSQAPFNLQMFQANLAAFHSTHSSPLGAVVPSIASVPLHQPLPISNDGLYTHAFQNLMASGFNNQRWTLTPQQIAAMHAQFPLLQMVSSATPGSQEAAVASSEPATNSRRESNPLKRYSSSSSGKKGSGPIKEEQDSEANAIPDTIAHHNRDSFSSASGTLLPKSEIAMRPKHIHTGTLPSISAGDIQHTSEGNALPDLSNPTVSSTTAGESVSIASEIEETIDIPSNTVYPSSNFQSTAPLEAAFFAQNIEVGVSSHILFLVRQLTQSKQPRVSIHSTTSGSNRVYVKDYSDVFSKSLPSTPSAVFSSSGIIYTCNIAFARLVQLDHATLVSGQFCVFSLVDMPSMLSVLDLALSYSLKKDAQSFGRCSVFSGGNTRPQSYQQHPHQQPTSQSQGGQRTWIRHCSLAISTLHDSGLWVVAQFIPIM